MIATALGCGHSSSCSGGVGCASRRRSRWASATSIRGGGRCSCAKARVAVGARSAWTPGGWEQLSPWLGDRVELPVGPLFCIIDGPTRGRPWSGAAVRTQFRRLAARAGVRRRFAPPQLRHAHALELTREGVPLNISQRQLGHANLATTSIYLQGIDPEEIIATVRIRRASASAGLRL